MKIQTLKVKMQNCNSRSKSRKKVKIGVIGAGAIAQHHLKVLSSFEDVEIRAVANRRPEPRETTQKEYGISNGFADLREMLEKEKLDAVYVLVSAANIYRVSEECLKFGIPLFIEKPPGLTLKETKKLAALAAWGKIPVMVGLNRRFYSVIRKAKATIEERGPLLGVVVEAPERINEVKQMEKFRGLTDRWLVLNGMHGIDLLRFLGGEINSVNTVSRSLREKNGDNFGALIRFKNKAIGHYISHWQSPGRWAIDLYGDGIRAHLEPLEEGVIFEGANPPVAIEPDEKDKTFKPGFWQQSRYFIDRVKDKKPIKYPACSIEDAVATMELVERINH